MFDICLLDTFSWDVCSYRFSVICAMIQCGIYAYNIKSSYYVIMFSKVEFNFYTHITWLHRINMHKAVQLSSDRGRHGLWLHMPFVFFMNECGLVCSACRWHWSNVM